MKSVSSSKVSDKIANVVLHSLAFEPENTSAYVSIRQHTSACTVLRVNLRSLSHSCFRSGVFVCVCSKRYYLSSKLGTAAGSLAFEPEKPFRRAACVQHASAYVSIRQHASACVTAYVSVRQRTSAYVSIRHLNLRSFFLHSAIRQHTSAYVSICQRTFEPEKLFAELFAFSNTSAYVSIRQHMSAYVSIRLNLRSFSQSCLRSTPGSYIPIHLYTL